MEPFLVAGTGSWSIESRLDWYCPGHPFGQFLETHGLTPTWDNNLPFIWSTDLSGVPWTRRHSDWAAGGAALAYFVIAKQRRPGARTALVVHSHGLQVVAYAAAHHDLKIHTLISVGSPIRKDMGEAYMKMRANTDFWLHIHSDGSDRWQWLGELFDGRLGIVREAPLADQNDRVPKVGHSDLLRDPQRYHYWVDRGWIDRLKG